MIAGNPVSSAAWWYDDADAAVSASCLRYFGLARNAMSPAPAAASVATWRTNTEPSPSALRQDGRRFRQAASPCTRSPLNAWRLLAFRERL